MRNTTGYSRPFAECSVINVTELASGSFSSMSVTSEIASRNACTRASPSGWSAASSALAPMPTPPIATSPPKSPRSTCSSNSRAEPTSSCRFSTRPCASIERSDFQLGEVAAARQHRFERGRDPARGRVGGLAHQLEQILEPAERLAGHAGGGRVGDRGGERHARAARVRVDLRDRRVADAAPRRVDDALPRHFVVGVHERAEVRQRVLDLAPVVELHAAEHAVRHARANQRLLEHAALRVGAVEDGDVAVAVVGAVDEAVDLAHDERRFVVLVVTLEADDRLALALVGPELLGPVRRVVLDHRVGRVEDALRRPVVLVEHHRHRFGKRLLELQQVPKVRPAELVDRVVRDDAVGDEVVRAVDVDVVDRLVDLRPSRRRHDVERHRSRRPSPCPAAPMPPA